MGDVNHMSFYTKNEYVAENNIGRSNVTVRHGGPIKTCGTMPGLKKFLAEYICDFGFEDTLKNAGLGEVKLPEFVYDEIQEIEYIGHAHNMGTTRMALSADDRLVDADCKVFGTDNLCFAGSSVFSRGGGNNPTMPLLQLSLRLCDHLQANVV